MRDASRLTEGRGVLRLTLLAIGCVLLGAAGAHAAAPFDRTHAAWTTLLTAHVRWNDAGTADGVPPRPKKMRMRSTSS